MAKVTNLVVKLQTGTTSTYYATWGFNETTKTTSSAVKANNLVSIKPGATYYNGVAIPDWVMADQWYVIEVIGARAVLGKNASGTHNIQSPIHVNNLVGGTSVSTTTNTLSHYTASWSYDTGDGVWFKGDSENITDKLSTYEAPAHAIRVKVTVTPVAKTYKANNVETAYWTGTAVTSEEYGVDANPPEVPGTPNVDVEKYQLTASLENIADPRTDEIRFEIYNGTNVIDTKDVTVITCRASYSCAVNPGGDYRVRCKAINLNGTSKVESAWSSFSSSVSTIPSAPTGITECKATSKTSVYIEWETVSTAKTYELEYTTKKNYFDGSDQTTTVSGIEYNHYEKTGLESGQEYFFRVRAVNDKGESAWTDIKSVIIGKDPAAPTTWSSTTTVITGEPLTLYWVHNTEDGSSQTYAELELYINGVLESHTIKNSEDEDEKDKTSFFPVNTSYYNEGTTIQWRVRTAGITKAYGDWSIQRTVDVYAPPTLELRVTDAKGNSLNVLNSFPFYVKGLAGPNTQEPIGYHVVITSNKTYNTVDSVGNPKLVNQNDEVYSKYFDTKEPLTLELLPSSVDLENNIEYTVTCVVSMNSGLTGIASSTFKVAWTDEVYEPNAEIGVDTNTFTAYISPYCRDVDDNLVENVTLSVYRREFDGSFTEIASGIDNTKNTIVTDPHPALDFARYRILATSKTTGTVNYYDPPGYPVGGKAVIIQWNEGWSNFNAVGESELEQSPWSGSFIKLPYNVDVSDSNTADVALIEYIGRARPIAYYGTQLGSKATWNVAIPKSDKDTLYALRRLSVWMGDVYVREPSGSGYWANVSVSFSQKHADLVIPVTLNITRVEGGI